MMTPIFINADGLTMFGTPWEINFQNNYVIRRKGGNIDGYSALFSVIPELQIGLSILWNGQTDEYAFSTAGYDILIPALVSALMEMQPVPPQPSNPSAYYGTYTVSGQSYFNCVIEQYNQYMNIVITLGNTYYSTFLYYNSPTSFQLYIPQGDGWSCLMDELIALNNQYVYFNLDNNGNPYSLTIPGWIYALTFVKN